MSYDNTEAQRPRTRRWRDDRIRGFDTGQYGVIAPHGSRPNEGDSPAGQLVREEGAGRSSPTSATIISFPVSGQEREGVEDAEADGSADGGRCR